MIQRAVARIWPVAVILSSTTCTELDEECVFTDGSDPSLRVAENMAKPIEQADRVVSPEVRAYLEARLQKMEVIATTTTKSGQVYDWIDINSQVADGEVATPPPLEPSGDANASSDTCRPLTARTELEDEPEALGPPGTVPVLRIDPDRIHAPGSVQDFLSKYGDATDIPSQVFDENVPLPQVNPASGHFYAMTQMRVNNYGGDGYISVWQPFVLFPTEQSLAQVAISSGELPIPMETIEAGWTVNGALYGDLATRLFVYFTTTAYKELGDFKGGYNMNQAGWVQVSRTKTPGTRLTSVSVAGGPQVDFYIRVELHEGKWWVRYDDEFIGYYPASIFGADRLGTSAKVLQFFAETNDDPNIEGMTVNDMGSGKFPGLATWRGNAAFMRNLRHQKAPQGYEMADYLPKLTKATHPKCYGLIGNYEATDPFYSQFYFGGPGQSADCP
jgi:hypothetical protein